MTSPDPDDLDDDLYDEAPETDAPPVVTSVPSYSGGIDLDALRRLKSIKDERGRAARTVKSLAPDVRSLIDELITQFAETGQRDISADGFRATPTVTVYGSRDEDACPDPDDFYGAFEAAGEPWASLVTSTIHAKKLAALLGKIQRDNKGKALRDVLPPEIARVLKISPTYDITFAKTSETAAQTALRSASI